MYNKQMPLSLQKLEDLLLSKGFVCSKFFSLDGYCFYIEVFSLKTADVFLLYIPSKYNFEISGDNVNVCKMKSINMDGSDNIPDEYGKKQDDINMDDIYGNTYIEVLEDKDNIEEHLENNYKRPISLKDISDEDMNVLKAIYRQMKRFKYCVQNLKYKLGIIYKNYICSIRRDDSIDSFILKNYRRDSVKRLMIIVDLETLIDKNEKLIYDIKVVRESVYSILERNQGLCTKVITKILENKKDIILIPKQVEKKKQIYNGMMLELFNMLKKMEISEEKILDEIHKLENNDKVDGIQNDITRLHNKTRYEKELDNINSVKSDITKNILCLREKIENKILTIDKICFDNSVMLDAMIKNFSKLKTILLE
jgi:hypothetical protein